ncbi:hypothetical protein V8E53_010324 [Lactarius tabidus]
MDWMPLWTNACDRGRWTRQSDSACAAVLGRVRPPRRSGATRYEPRHGWFLPWGALRVVLKRKRFSPCTSAKSDRRAYVGEQFGWAAAGPHGPRLGYGLVTLVMRRRGSFGCDAFDGLYYRTNGLFYILYLYGTSSHNAIQSVIRKKNIGWPKSEIFYQLNAHSLQVSRQGPTAKDAFNFPSASPRNPRIALAN